jgi:hypothetical protein
VVAMEVCELVSRKDEGSSFMGRHLGGLRAEVQTQSHWG